MPIKYHVPKRQKYMVITVHNFGLNNLDLEGRVEENAISQKINTISINLSGFHGARTAFELPPRTGFEVIFNDKLYYGILDTNTKTDPPKIFPNSKGGVTIVGDEKFDLLGKLETNKPEGIENFWRIKITEATGGGGAHNTAFGQQIYIPENEDEIKIKLIVPIGHSMIKEKLPKNLEYVAIHGINDVQVPSNLNFAPVNGKKITLRSKPAPFSYEDKKLDINSGDVIVLNTVRDSAYLNLLENTLNSNQGIRLFLAATDSMISSIGIEKVWELIKRSEVYVSNREELEKLVKSKINDAKTLKEKMNEVQSKLLTRDSLPGRIYITFGEAGSAALGQDKIAYYQPTAAGYIDPFKKLNIVNTNGCGDAYLSVVVIKEILAHPTSEILNYANAAGHICATKPTASGEWMANVDRIKEFRDNYGRPAFHRYDPQKNEFVIMH